MMGNLFEGSLILYGLQLARHGHDRQKYWREVLTVGELLTFLSHKESIHNPRTSIKDAQNRCTAIFASGANVFSHRYTDAIKKLEEEFLTRKQKHNGGQHIRPPYDLSSIYFRDTTCAFRYPDDCVVGLQSAESTSVRLSR